MTFVENAGRFQRPMGARIAAIGRRQAILKALAISAGDERIDLGNNGLRQRQAAMNSQISLSYKNVPMIRVCQTMLVMQPPQLRHANIYPI